MKKRLKDILACPTCRSALTEGHRLTCLACGATFEERHGVPVLLDEESRREIDKFYGGRPQQEDADRQRKQTASRLEHWLTHPPSRKIGDKTVPNLKKLWSLLKERESDPLVLTVGKIKSRINRENSDDDADVRALEAVSVRLDIKAGPGVAVVGDGHKLPFLDNSFDAAIGLTTVKHLRNPFTFAVRASDGHIHINDVGQSAWEEINLGVAGANYGWPSTEGPTNAAGITGPLFAFDHSSGADNVAGFFSGCSVVGGAFYPDAGPFPQAYRGSYYFTDYCTPVVGRLDLANGNVAYAFGSVPGSPVGMTVTSDGALLVLTRSAVVRFTAP